MPAKTTKTKTPSKPPAKSSAKSPASKIDIASKNLTDKIEKFLGKISSSDVLIIKAHLISEYYINQILILKQIMDPSGLDRKTFSHKIDLLFDPRNNTKPTEMLLYDKAKKLNLLRNKVGHQLEFALSETDIDSIGFYFGKDYINQKYKITKHIDLLHHVLVNVVLEFGVKLNAIVTKVQ